MKKKEEKGDYESDKLVIDLLSSLTNRRTGTVRRLIASLTKKQKKELIAIIERMKGSDR